MPAAEAAATVLVAGSINMDIVATAGSIPLPGETVAGHELQYYPCGKGANQAIAASRAGVSTRMIGKIGADSFGQGLMDYLADEKVDVSIVMQADGPSGIALIVVEDSGQNSIVVVPGANGEVDEGSLVDAAFTGVAVGVSQFEIPVPAIERFFDKCRARGITTLLNAAPALPDAGRTLELADVLVLNETELNTYAGCRLSESAPAEEVLDQARAVRRFPTQTVVVTLGKQGAVALDGEQAIVSPGIAVNAVDTTGAGDCFVGYLAAALASGQGIADGLALAGRAAALSVQRPGAAPSMPYREDLQ